MPVNIVIEINIYHDLPFKVNTQVLGVLTVVITLIYKAMG